MASNFDKNITSMYFMNAFPLIDIEQSFFIGDTKREIVFQQHEQHVN
jgi:hypothetical protein